MSTYLFLMMLYGFQPTLLRLEYFLAMPLCMYINIHLFIGHAYMTLLMYVEASGQPTAPSSKIHLPPQRKDLALAYISQTTLDLGPSKPQGSGCVCLPRAGILCTTINPLLKCCQDLDPHACKVSTLLINLCLQFYHSILNTIVISMFAYRKLCCRVFVALSVWKVSLLLMFSSCHNIQHN